MKWLWFTRLRTKIVQLKWAITVSLWLLGFWSEPIQIADISYMDYSRQREPELFQANNDFVYIVSSAIQLHAAAISYLNNIRQIYFCSSAFFSK